MTWSYAPGETDRDIVREMVADIDPDDPLASDEAIDKYLTDGSLAQANLYLSAISVAKEIRAKFARAARSVAAGASRVDWGDRVKDYDAILADLAGAAAALAGGSAAPYAGGISIADVLAREADTDRVAPYFAREPGTLADPARWGR